MSNPNADNGRPNCGQSPANSTHNQSSGTIHGSSVQARSIYGGVQFNVETRSQLPIPAQLPSPGFFADRHDEVRDLRQLIDRPVSAGHPTLIVISGPGGVGKTTLGLHWLNQIRDEYADGQLFVDLHGFSDGRPMPPSEPLERFLRALGIPAESVPIDLDEQAALFRSLTAGRRLITMLDNAASAAQVRPLLPGPGPALVVVTSRRRMSGLVMEGARFFDVNPLHESGAVELLHHIVGAERIAAEQSEAMSLVALCGRLPLALCASGARLAARRRWPIARVVGELTDETRRLSALSVEDDVSVQAVFDLSYQALPEDAARLYGLLGLHPGADFDTAVAGALAYIGHDESARLLDMLADANLLEEGSEDRYSFHDLVRLHARGKLAETTSGDERQAAFARLVDRYLQTAVSADIAIMPGRWHLGAYYEAERRISFPDRAAALAWLELELGNIMAVLRAAHRKGLHEAVWQTCEAMWGLFLLHKHYRQWIEAHEIGVAAARACGDPVAQARMLEALGFAYLNLKDFDAARHHHDLALRLEEEADHPIGEASALEGLGIAELATGGNDRAIELFTRARRIHQRLGRPRGVALMRRHIGEALSGAGRHAEAVEDFSAALRFFEQADEPYHQARTLTSLANSHLSAGRLDDADDVLSRSLLITERSGARHEQAGVHASLAHLAARRGQGGVEREHLHKALAIYTELGAPQAQEVGDRLARTERSHESRDRGTDPP
ncbi:ATP-binding protein [Actinomadura alba]